ncbi:Homoserine kinase [Syntrophomonas zehnderi OL-4]|uniref:Homoserine kinase n=1 Tax=Syntrophomonas zehnderi OL-4 TaxID=690567 RepID=A0A0E4G9R1_9FIRM|nr:homoserine kinase [Syntrophomonas zehnderi]CFX20664.1 Homoserine kinase [Syntrophomonas zehnderi OL-4]
MVKIRVPATTANLGPGLDTLGMALSLYLTVEMTFSGQGTTIEFTGYGRDELMEKPEQNLVYKAACLVMQQAGLYERGLKLHIHNEIPVGKGLGSSASAIVAGIYAANRLLKKPFAEEQLLSWAVKMEGHADNIVPAVVGGLAIVMQRDEDVFYQQLEVPSELKTVLAVPEFVLATTQSRSVLPTQISLANTVSSLQRACFLIASLVNADYSQLAAAMHDPVFLAERKNLIPGFDRVLANALKAGALGAALSGAGPSVIALTLDKTDKIGEAMQESFAAAGISSEIFILRPSENGIKYLDEDGIAE